MLDLLDSTGHTNFAGFAVLAVLAGRVYDELKGTLIFTIERFEHTTTTEGQCSGQTLGNIGREEEKWWCNIFSEDPVPPTNRHLNAMSKK